MGVGKRASKSFLFDFRARLLDIRQIQGHLFDCIQKEEQILLRADASEERRKLRSIL